MHSKIALLLLLFYTTNGHSIRENAPPASATTEKPVSSVNSSEQENSSSSYEDSSWYYDYSSEEDPCPLSKFWHTRGRRCVPFRCPRANHLRDRNTGECLYKDTEVLKSFGGGGDRRTAFATRTVLKPVGASRIRGTRINGKGFSSWQPTRQRKRVELSEDMANPTKSLFLIRR